MATPRTGRGSPLGGSSRKGLWAHGSRRRTEGCWDTSRCTAPTSRRRGLPGPRRYGFPPNGSRWFPASSSPHIYADEVRGRRSCDAPSIALPLGGRTSRWMWLTTTTTPLPSTSIAAGARRGQPHSLRAMRATRFACCCSWRLKLAPDGAPKAIRGHHPAVGDHTPAIQPRATPPQRCGGNWQCIDGFALPSRSCVAVRSPLHVSLGLTQRDIEGLVLRPRVRCSVSLAGRTT